MPEEARSLPVAPRFRLKRRAIIAGLAAVPALTTLYAFLIEPYWIDVTRHEAGAGSREMTILHLTDLHFTTMGSRERRVLEIASDVAPDLIIVTGDSVLRDYDQDGLVEFYSRLSAPLGVYACRGNWEDWVGPSVADCYRKAGVRLLDDTAQPIGEGAVELIGISSVRSTFPAGSPARLRIALCHYPAILPEAAAAGIDYVFAGHTHGGQVRLPLIGAPHLPFDSGGYEAGWYEEGSCRMYVSRGVGTSILPVRFLCRPEVAIHRIRFDP